MSSCRVSPISLSTAVHFPSPLHCPLEKGVPHPSLAPRPKWCRVECVTMTKKVGNPVAAPSLPFLELTSLRSLALVRRRSSRIFRLFVSRDKIGGENWILPACQNRCCNTKWMEMDVTTEILTVSKVPIFAPSFRAYVLRTIAHLMV